MACLLHPLILYFTLASCISVAISHAEAMCTATERRCACSASHVDVDQLTSFSYCRFVSVFHIYRIGSDVYFQQPFVYHLCVCRVGTPPAR